MPPRVQPTPDVLTPSVVQAILSIAMVRERAGQAITIQDSLSADVMDKAKANVELNRYQPEWAARNRDRPLEIRIHLTHPG